MDLESQVASLLAQLDAADRRDQLKDDIISQQSFEITALRRALRSSSGQSRSSPDITAEDPERKRQASKRAEPGFMAHTHASNSRKIQAPAKVNNSNMIQSKDIVAAQVELDRICAFSKIQGTYAQPTVASQNRRKEAIRACQAWIPDRSLWIQKPHNPANDEANNCAWSWDDTPALSTPKSETSGSSGSGFPFEITTPRSCTPEKPDTLNGWTAVPFKESVAKFEVPSDPATPPEPAINISQSTQFEHLAIDTDWTTRSEGMARLNSTAHRRLLELGLEVATDTLHKWWSEHNPAFAKRWAPHGSQDLLLDRENQIKMGLGWGRSTYQYREVFGDMEITRLAELRQSVFEGIGQLRNAICHFAWWNATPKDTFTKLVPVLAVTIYLEDEENEKRIRQLLEWLKDEAIKSNIDAQAVWASADSGDEMSTLALASGRLPTTPIPQDVTEWSSIRRFEMTETVGYDLELHQDFLARTHVSAAVRERNRLECPGYSSIGEFQKAPCPI